MVQDGFPRLRCLSLVVNHLVSPSVHRSGEKNGSGKCKVPEATWDNSCQFRAKTGAFHTCEPVVLLLPVILFDFLCG